MTSENLQSPYGLRSSRKPTRSGGAKCETTLKSEQVQIERKNFVFLLKENDRGRFLRIIEQSDRHSNSLIVPAGGLEEFRRLLMTMSQTAMEPPPKQSG